MFIGKTIRKIRLEKLLKQSYVASKLGMSQTNYSNIENDITKVTEILLEKIAIILDVSVSELKNQIVNEPKELDVRDTSQFEINHLKDMIGILKEEVKILQETLGISNSYNKTLLENKIAIEEHLRALQKENSKSPPQ